MRVAITGETGFLGYHLTQYLHYHLGYEIVSLSRDYQNNIHLVNNCDWLIHCAGINKGLNSKQNNLVLANELIVLLKRHNITVNIAYASSVQVFYNTDYGNDKNAANNVLANYCKEVNSKFISYKLPNLFGPFGKPNYNSVVATFCFNLINNNKSQVNDNEVELCYVYDAIQTMSLDNSIQQHVYGTNKISVIQLYLKLKEFHKYYSAGIIPNLSSVFDIQLFNTYRSYANNMHSFTRHVDDRGHLLELIKCNGSESQIFFSTTKPNITRGNHFHFNKVERFCIIKGTASILLKKLGSDKIIQYIITDNMDTVIDIPILHIHNITNIGNEELICLFWVNEIFDKNNTDTYFVQI